MICEIILGFDIFSSGLLFCQFIFSLLDERMDAGFSPTVGKKPIGT
jgi:hypothetical protein